MIDVKNEKNHDTKAEPTVSVKPLEMLAFSDSHDASDSKAGAPGAATAAARELAAGSREAGSRHARSHAHSPEAGSTHTYTRQDVGVAIGIIASALLLTYGNILMEMLFNLLGI